MRKPFLLSPFSTLAISVFLVLNLAAAHHEHTSIGSGPLVKKSERTPLIETEYGHVDKVQISAGERGPYHLEFITLDPNSLFLPVLLHADMVFYVHTGSGMLTWADDDETKTVNLRRGDIYRLQPGSVFYVQSNLEQEREKLRIHAFFSNTDNDSYEPSIGAYSIITNLVFGFGSKILQAGFKVPEEVVAEMTNTTRPPLIVHAKPKKKMTILEFEARFLKTILSRNRGDFFDFENKKKKTKAYNILDAEPDFQNCNGWSTTVDRKDLKILKGSNVGVFMVNLTKGSMMAPHWNPSATEIAVVLEGEGMVRMVCSSRAKQSECKNMRFRVREGDVFAVPRFHPMAQMSFSNNSLVFMGFSTTTKKNYPQFLVGKYSVLQIMDKGVLALSFNVTNTTLDKILSQQGDSIILDCTSCAEEEESIMEEEIRKKKEEEAQKREEEETKKKQEEEARKREEEEEEEARRQKEERRQREKEQEQKQEEEEEAKKREEERRQREKEQERKREEEARKREEKEAKKKEEEEAKRQEKEQQQKEKAKERKREEEEEARKREEKEEEKVRRQEEERRQREKQREQEEKEREEEEQREEEEASKREKEERRQEEAATREQEEARRQEKERQRRAREEEKEEWEEPETTIKRRPFWI